MKLSAADVQGKDCDDFLHQHLLEEKHYEISLSDIQDLPTFKELIVKNKHNSLDVLYKYLHILGMDTTKNVESQFCTHRNRSNKVVECDRWVGYQRTDKQWLDNKNKRG